MDEHIDELFISIEEEAALETARLGRIWREQQTWADDPEFDDFYGE